MTPPVGSTSSGRTVDANNSLPWRYNTRTRVSPVDPTTFTGKLNRLFAVIYPPGRGPYTSREVSLTLRMRGCDVSEPYLSQLRSGKRKQPSWRVITELAEFFGVRPQYFTDADPDYTKLLDAELHWLELAHDPHVRKLTTALLELPAELRDDALRAVS
ncbi:helix-turn-helix domain-containing protein [Mycobacterium hackensackense]|uniref:helix-turn-helix domain-containing protein n=1 Tax=Mycobacterium hackensackense TaxID=228909 RepID=UPI002265BCC6|nr:helix-turn-helix transcriptional regulator [Mycobacterium hackensackense]